MEKKGFFKKVWYCIDKIEKYSELAAEGFGRAIKYLAVLIIILAIISSVATVYKTSLEIENIAQYINEKVPELSYNNETLNVDSQEAIIDTNDNFGKIIIDTNTEEEEKINEYLKDVEEGNAIIILKDKLILKEIGGQGTNSYKYKEIFNEMDITEFNKQNLVEYLTSSNMMSLYLNLFLVLFIYAFMIYFINTLCYIVVISIFGYLVSIMLKLKMRYIAIFNMAVYSITLPTILNMVYIGINCFYKYNIKYFDVMYMLVASIYMIAAIFILKSEFNKKQGQVTKIVEVENQVKEELKEENKKNNDTEKKEDKEDKEENNQEDDEQAEGSKA